MPRAQVNHVSADVDVGNVQAVRRPPRFVDVRRANRSPGNVIKRKIKWGHLSPYAMEFNGQGCSKRTRKRNADELDTNANEDAAKRDASNKQAKKTEKTGTGRRKQVVNQGKKSGPLTPAEMRAHAQAHEAVRQPPSDETIPYGQPVSTGRS